MKRIKHVITKNQAKRRNCTEGQVVWVVLKSESEKHWSNKDVRMAKAVYNASGERIGGNFDLDD